MDPKEAETQRKMKAMAAYIEKQLATGTSPKDLHADLIERKAPHDLVVEMIEAELARQNAPGYSPPSAEDDQSTREELIRAFINVQADAGKTVDEIHHMLVQKKVSPQQAADLILDETGRIVYLPDDGTQVSSTLSMETAPDIIPPIENLRQMAIYIKGQLASGVEPKDLVDSLVQNGMERNAAIDAVMDAKEKLDRDQKSNRQP